VICKTIATRRPLGSDLLLANLLPSPSAASLHRVSRTLSTYILPLREVTLGRQGNANDRNRYNDRRLPTTIIKERSDPHWVRHRSRSHNHNYAGRGNHHFFLEALIQLVTIAAFAQVLITLSSPTAHPLLGCLPAAQATQTLLRHCSPVLSHVLPLFIMSQ
jgi:hypothetical protein